MQFNLRTKYLKTLSDTTTPVQLYYQIRDQFPNSILLESSDHNSKQNSYTYICFKPLASFIVNEKSTQIIFPNNKRSIYENDNIDIIEELNLFIDSFKVEFLPLNFITSGLFGYLTYDAIPLIEDITFKEKKNQSAIPLIHYQFFKHVIVFDHYHNNLYSIEHLLENESSSLDEINDIINHKAFVTHQFKTQHQEQSNYTDVEFKKIIEQGKYHCKIGDVFQIVLSRKFTQSFTGDAFNVYRALRSINPSPYLFYFDYGSYSIFGSSPEAQLTIQNNKAIIHPIAGTFKKTGNDEDDELLEKELLDNEKENAEHIMLVDLARNDLSKLSNKVIVESYKKVEYYSHVIHLVSKVSAALEKDYNPIQILKNTFPAGTLSGAPKYKAMQLIDEYEKDNRGFYGGTIGIIGLDKTINHAIFIRSFFCKDNMLSYQAGCGIVAKSDVELELQEVNNKLMALKKSIELAQNI